MIVTLPSKFSGKPFEKQSNPTSGWKNREKRNANPHGTGRIAAPADEAAEGVRRL
jgi:hypothetical protein